MTNRFNKHDFIEIQAKLDFFDNFFDMLEHSPTKRSREKLESNTALDHVNQIKGNIITIQ
jgi:hypothetical protein